MQLLKWSLLGDAISHTVLPGVGLAADLYEFEYRSKYPRAFSEWRELWGTFAC